MIPLCTGSGPSSGSTTLDLFTHLRNWLQSVEEERTDTKAKLELGLGPCAGGSDEDLRCSTCKGSGAERMSVGSIRCTRCGGTGRVPNSSTRHDFNRGTCMRCGALSDQSERQYAFAAQTFGLSESMVRLLLEHLTPLAPS